MSNQKILACSSRHYPLDPAKTADQREVGSALLQMLREGYAVEVQGGIVANKLHVTLKGTRPNPLYKGETA